MANEKDIKDISQTHSTNDKGFIGGITERLDETIIEYEPFYDLKIFITVDSYRKYDDSVQLIAYTTQTKKVEGTDIEYVEKEKHSIRLVKNLSDNELKQMIGKQFELTNVKEFHSYKQMPDGSMNYGNIVSTSYRAKSFKPAKEVIGTDFKVYRTIEITIDNVQPILKYDKKKRKQILSNDSIVQYMETTDTKNNIHQFIARNLHFKVMKDFIGKKVKVFDLNPTMFKGYKSWERTLLKAI